MADLIPFKAYRPSSNNVKAICCRPYDVLNAKEAREICKDNDISLDCRKTLAAKVFQRTSEYDYNITQYFNKDQEDQLPDSKNIYIEKVQDLRYGENPHQSGAFYIKKGGNLPLFCYL